MELKSCMSSPLSPLQEPYFLAVELKSYMSSPLSPLQEPYFMAVELKSYMSSPLSPLQEPYFLTVFPFCARFLFHVDTIFFLPMLLIFFTCLLFCFPLFFFHVGCNFPPFFSLLFQPLCPFSSQL